MNAFKKIMACGLFFTMLCMVDTGEAQAQKGGGSRPSFGGGSRPSFGGGSKPSFSGGSKPSIKVAAPSKPSFGGGSSKPAPSIKPPSFSGGSSTPKAPAGSSKPTFSGGSSTPSKGSPTDKPKFGGGSTSPPSKVVTTTPIAGKTPTSVSKKPAAESFDKLSTTEARKIESRKAYTKSDAPAPSYTTPGGKSVPIAKGDKQSDYLRGRLDESHWQSRYQRSDVFYGGYAGRPIIVYHDMYHPMWNYWLASQTIDVMSLWMYHHHLTMDAARREAMYAQNADLRARVAALERQGIPRDPTYTPKNVDPDMAYNDNYVNAVYNPRPKMVDHYEYNEDGVPVRRASPGVGRVLLWIFVYIPLIFLGLFCLYWLVFVKKW